jgi:transposase
MIKITFSELERQQLATTFTTTTDRRLRNRCQAILMAARGRRHAHIATDLGVTSRPLQRWLNAYRKKGLDGLPIQWAPGRPPLIAVPQAPEILRWIKRGPAGCGLDRAHWTYAKLAPYLSQTTGITVSETTMRTFCAKHGVRPYRPTYEDLKGDPDKQAAARQDLETLKKSHGRRTRFIEPG